MIKSMLSGLLLAIGLVLVTTGCEDKKSDHYADTNWSDANLVRGGLLYDKWWKVNDGTEPTTDFDPIWSSQTTNTRSGSTTWRCKECHGWDYKGIDGAYSSGSHKTGFTGVWAARTEEKSHIFDQIAGSGEDHDLTGVLSDADLLDLTKFITDGLIDMSLYIDYSSKDALGDSTAGLALYTSTCASCHGADGNTIDIDGAGLGAISNGNPWESLHKIRFGHPGSSMPSAVNDGKSVTDQVNILTYIQTL